jgi:hypothetical protein
MTDSYGGWVDPTPVVENEEGEHIVELQERLQQQGVPVETTGRFDEQTQAAVHQVAQANGGAAATDIEAIAAVARATGPLLSPAWQQKLYNPDATYGYQANLEQKYHGEEYGTTGAFAKDQLQQTYYPTEQAAHDLYGVQVEDGYVTVPGEQDAQGNATYVDTTGVETGAGLLGSKPERMIYTMDAEGDLRVADAKHEGNREEQRFHHSSLASGQEVAGAGEMKIRDGVVETVSDRSGHYKPNLGMTQQVNDRLAEGGVDTSRVTYELTPQGGIGNDTLVSGTELNAYDRDALLSDLEPTLRRNADAQARGQINASPTGELWPQQEDSYKKAYTPIYDASRARLEAMTSEELMAEARTLIEQRHATASAGGAAAVADRSVARWHEDPSGRHQWRWHDGTGWTSQVSDNDATSDDPDPTGVPGGFAPQAQGAPAPAAAAQQPDDLGIAGVEYRG